MRRQKPTTSSHVVLVDPSGRVIAADNATALTALGPGGEPTVIGVDAYPAQAVRVFNRMERAEDGLVRYDAGGASYLGFRKPVSLRNGDMLSLLITLPERELLAAARRALRENLRSEEPTSELQSLMPI